MSIVIRREEEKDTRKVEELIRDSFWNVYHPGALEHYVMHGFRTAESFVPELDLVLEKDGELIGQVMYAHAELKGKDGTVRPCMTFGPICIANEYKRQGYGKLLLDASLEKARELGCGALCFEGNIAFYGKSGFTYAREFGIRYHGLGEGEDSSFFLCRELTEHYLDGVTGEYSTPKGYFAGWENPEDFEKYDATFPAREKRVLPGQLNK